MSDLREKADEVADGLPLAVADIAGEVMDLSAKERDAAVGVIHAALLDARREGAEAMRAKCAAHMDALDLRGYADSLRSLALPVEGDGT